jgi:predicted small secreted protein
MRKALFSMAILVVCAVVIAGCTDTEMAGFDAYGKSQHIKQFSGGQLIGEWDSTGKVLNEPQSDGYRFSDEKTHKIVRVSGTVQITVNE